MTDSLARPEITGLLSHWTLQPVAVLLVAALACGYWRGVRKLDTAWPVRRSVTFGVGLVVLVWTTCGFPEAYADSLFWVWTSQTLTLWLVIPLIILFGQPVQLAQAVSGPGGRIDRVLASRCVRILGNPLVGPALVPVLSAFLFFGPLPGWSIQWPAVGWVLHVVLLAVGAVMVIPLVGLEETASSMAVGASLAIGSFELVIDALPGIILRLHGTLMTSYFDHRAVQSWAPGALHDQQIAGAILWCVAEIIDLPFLVLVYRRWLRADARDAARIDAVLAAERAARKGLEPETSDDGPLDPTTFDDDRDAPWWLSDPAMQARLKRNP